MFKKQLILSAMCFVVIMLFISCSDSTGPNIEDSLELYAGLEVIPEASNSVVKVNRGSNSAKDGYFKLTVDNIKANTFLKPGEHEAWCLEWNKGIRSSGDVHAGVKWFSSETNDKWKPLNYFFSIRNDLQNTDPSLTFLEIQAVVWVLAGEMGIAPEFDVMSLPVNQLPARLVKNGQPNFSREKVSNIARSVIQKAPTATVLFSGVVAQTAENEQDLYVPPNDLLNAFVTKWDTNLGSNPTVTLALGGIVNATIDWGDGNISTVTSSGPHTHTYVQDGVYTVSVTGGATVYNSELYSSTEESKKLLEVVSWGNLGFEDFSSAFYQAINLTAVPNHSYGIESVTDMYSMFRDASSFNAPIGHWNTENVTSFYRMFDSATNFNQPIGDWNTSSVELTMRMFYGTSFNQPIGDWDTSSMTNISNMFLTADNFNQPIGDWNTSSVVKMKRTFGGANSFNQPIGNWDTSQVTDMSGMFGNANSFNQDLSGWCVENISTEPSGFDSGADDWILARPDWGTSCTPI